MSSHCSLRTSRYVWGCMYLQCAHNRSFFRPSSSLYLFCSLTPSSSASLSVFTSSWMFNVLQTEMENLITWKDSCSFRCISSSPLLVSSLSLSLRIHDYLDWPSCSTTTQFGCHKAYVFLFVPPFQKGYHHAIYTAGGMGVLWFVVR